MFSIEFFARQEKPKDFSKNRFETIYGYGDNKSEAKVARNFFLNFFVRSFNGIC